VLMAKADEWAKRVAEWRASGLKAAEFCVDREYSAKNLWHWSSKLGPAEGGRDARKPAVRLVRVKRRSSRAVPLTAASNMVIEMNGARLTLHGQIDADALRTVVETLRTLAIEEAR
jgi:transposase